MAYCKNCGAYIPDGHTKCLACGQEENAQNQSSTNSATATAGEKDSRVDSEMLRRQLEEQRKKQQENSRKWAEAERARREAQQESKTSASGRSNIYEEDFEFNHGRSSSSSRSTGNNKVLAALSYLSVLFALPMLFCRDDDFAIFHAKQGLRLFVVSAILEVLGGIVGFGWLVTLFRIYFIYKGMTNASAGKWEPLPYIGSLGAQK